MHLLRLPEVLTRVPSTVHVQLAPVPVLAWNQTPLLVAARWYILPSKGYPEPRHQGQCPLRQNEIGRLVVGEQRYWSRTFGWRTKRRIFNMSWFTSLMYTNLRIMAASLQNCTTLRATRIRVSNISSPLLAQGVERMMMRVTMQNRVMVISSQLNNEVQNSFIRPNIR